MNEEPVSLVFSGQRGTVLANTNSVGFKNQGGMDWLVFQLDAWARNQCTALGITAATGLTFQTSDFTFTQRTASFQAIADVNAADVTGSSGNTLQNA